MRAFVREGRGQSEAFIRFAREHAFTPKTKLGPIDHFIGIVARGTTVQAFLQYYGSLHYVISLATDYHGPPFSFGYLVNPIRDCEPAETRKPEFDAVTLPWFLDHPEIVTEDSISWMKTKLNEVLPYHVRLGREKCFERIIKEVLAPYAGRPVTSELNRELAERIAVAFAPSSVTKPTPLYRPL